jgi:ATP-dependent helicase/nuclease subunit A
MTRAERWLVVCGAGDHKADGATWYDEIERGLTEAGAVSHPMPTGEGLRLSHGDWSAGPLVPRTAGAEAGGTIDGWMTMRAEPAERPTKPLSPSDLGGAKVLPGEGTDGDPAALERGTILHALLEHLPGCPAGARAGLAKAVLDGLGLPLAATEGDALVAHAFRLIDDPALAHVFADGTLAEVPVLGQPEGLGGHAVSGTIDRLVPGPDAVLAVDYKSNRLVPDRIEDVPEGLLRQMGAYAGLLAQAYPGRRIETAILWTATGRLMPLPHEMVMAALQRSATS